MNEQRQPLSDSDSANLEAKRTWVRNHYSEGSRGKYETLEGKLVLLDTILRSGWIAAHETLKLQCLGVTFGDALAQALGLEWMAIEDDLGRDPCLVLPGTSICVFPLTSISKRVEQGESVDARELFEAALRSVEQARAKLQ